MPRCTRKFFSYIRAVGSGYDKPSALQFKYRLRWYVLGKHYADMISESTNTENDEDLSLIDSVDFQDHDTTTNTAMIEIIDNLYDTEQIDFKF